MSTIQVLVAVGITTVAVALGIAIRRIMEAGVRFRGQRLVTCPQDHRPAGVMVDAAHAALTAWARDPELRLTGCTHWPERAACGQPCISQIEAAPEDCLVRGILTRWYDGKYCARCGKPVEEAYWDVCKPALLVPGDVLKEWDQIPAEQLPETLETARPVCFHCFIAATTSGHPVKLAAS